MVPQAPSDSLHPLLRITSAAQLALRGRILAAARQRLLRFRAEDTTLGDIARAAGLPEETVRQHFEDRHAVLKALQRGLDREPRNTRRHRLSPEQRARGRVPRPGTQPGYLSDD